MSQMLERAAEDLADHWEFMQNFWRSMKPDWVGNSYRVFESNHWSTIEQEFQTYAQALQELQAAIQHAAQLLNNPPQ